MESQVDISFRAEAKVRCSVTGIELRDGLHPIVSESQCIGCPKSLATMLTASISKSTSPWYPPQWAIRRAPYSHFQFLTMSFRMQYCVLRWLASIMCVRSLLTCYQARSLIRPGTILPDSLAACNNSFIRFSSQQLIYRRCTLFR